MKLSIKDIKVGKRHRKDMGDIDSLAQSIADVGLLHPVVVNKENRLIAGERRIQAFKKLGRPEISVTVIDLDQIVRGEAAENGERKDFTPTEIEDIRQALQPLEAAAAKERQREHGETAPGKHLRKVSSSDGRKLQTRDKIGAFAGVSGRQVEKIAVVMRAAKDDPKRFGHLPAEMDEKGVNRAYSQVSRTKKHKEIHEGAKRAPAQIIEGPFPVICADPPWKWDHFGAKGNENEAGKARTPDQHYPTLTYEEIEQFRIGKKRIKDIAAKDAALFMWCTSANFPLALKVVEAWGFTYKAHAVWVKTNDAGKPIGGTGLIFRNMHEPLIYATRGKMPGPQFQPGSVFMYPRRGHSQKPTEVLKIIEKMYPDFDASTRLNIFTRSKDAGWTGYGFESEG